MTFTKSKVWMGLIGALVIVWQLCSADPGPVALAHVPTPVASLPAWVTVESAADCAGGCWKVESLLFEDADTSGGNHHVYVQTREQGGEWVRRPYHVAWPDGNDRAESKLPPEWGDVPLWACFNPDLGSGPYRVYAGDMEGGSDVVRGLGLPQCQHVNYRILFRYQEQVIPPLPTVTQTPTIIPTATAVPCAPCTYRFYLPVLQS